MLKSSKTFENKLSQFFSLTKKKFFKLKNSNITGKCLLSLKEEFLKSISLSKCGSLEPTYIRLILQYYKNLSCIKLKKSSIEKSFLIECFELLNNCNKNINNIKLDFYFDIALSTLMKIQC